MLKLTFTVDNELPENRVAGLTSKVPGRLVITVVRPPGEPVPRVAVRAGVLVKMHGTKEIITVFFHAGQVFVFMGASEFRRKVIRNHSLSSFPIQDCQVHFIDQCFHGAVFLTICFHVYGCRRTAAACLYADP